MTYPFPESTELCSIDHFEWGACLVIWHEVGRTTHSYRLRVRTACGKRIDRDENSYEEAIANLGKDASTCLVCVANHLNDCLPGGPGLGERPFMQYRP